MTRRPRSVAGVVLAAAVAVAVLATGPVASAAEPEHARPQGPAKASFAGDFPRLVDDEWRFPLGGFGGVRRGAPLQHVPVIFVHGNVVDAADWYPVRDAFRAAGWSDQELWALSYNGLGSNAGTAVATPNPERDAEHRAMGWDGQVRVTNNEVNVPDLFAFITAVRSYTGSSRFVIVGHSLGVTLARRTLKVHPSLRADLVAFVGIAGGNHGTSLCPPGSEGRVVSCDEVAAGTPWLSELNGPDGSDETYGPSRWLTIADGSGVADPAFVGPTYADSPALAGADNRTFAGTYHNDLRVDAAIVEVYRTFIAEAEAAAGFSTAAAAGDAGPGSATAGAGTRPPEPRAGTAAGFALGTTAAPGAPVASSGAPSPPPSGAPSPAPAAVGPASAATGAVLASDAGGIVGDRSALAVWASAIVFVAGLGLLAIEAARRTRERAA